MGASTLRRTPLAIGPRTWVGRTSAISERTVHTMSTVPSSRLFECPRRATLYLRC